MLIDITNQFHIAQLYRVCPPGSVKVNYILLNGGILVVNCIHL